jgi:transcriptional regulator NrdR family protein
MFLDLYFGARVFARKRDGAPERESGNFARRGERTMIDVIKRDASRQPFSEQKLRRSIEAAAKEAKVSAQRIKQIVDDASREVLSLAKGTIPLETKTIREKILSKLDTIESSVSEAWRAFDRKRK